MKARIALIAAVVLLAPAAFVASIVASPAAKAWHADAARARHVRGVQGVRGTRLAHRVQGEDEIADGASSCGSTTTRSGRTTGWHTHPGHSVHHRDAGSVDVLPATTTRSCTPHVVSVGQGFVDDGRGQHRPQRVRPGGAGRERHHRARGAGVPRRARLRRRRTAGSDRGSPMPGAGAPGSRHSAGTFAYLARS